MSGDIALSDDHGDARSLADGFTAHNIVLPDGSQTLPGMPVLADLPLTQGALRIARRICPPSAERPPRVADLGCLEGGYAVEFARAGYEVVGIEARTDSVARCNFVRSRLGLENLVFVQDDARNLGAYGEFDIVLCFGLLYHLNGPVAFLRQLANLTRKLLLLDTHYADYQPTPNYPLSEIVEHEGVLGRWYSETPEGEWTSVAEMEASAWASWINTTSFWVLKEHLLKAMQDAGFQFVSEQFDAFENIAYCTGQTLTPGSAISRSAFVGIKDD
jgi:SAM-dependent methyltransferase